MRKTNCHCGLVAYANCTRCGSAVCYAHYNTSNSSLWCYLNYGLGKTLAEAAYARGYWSAPDKTYTCKDCRNDDGKRRQADIARQSRGWDQEPFMFALTAASVGYVITDPGITYERAVQAWLALNCPSEEVAVPRLVRPEKRRRVRRGVYEAVRPAKFTQDQYRGWRFACTIRIRTGRYNYHTDVEEWAWSGSTIIRTDGYVVPIDAEEKGPTYRLITEMARKLFVTHGHPWQGPPENWI